MTAKGLPVWLMLAEMALLVVAGPLITGVIQKVKARLQSREGAGVLQPYRDLAKLFRKGTVQSDSASGFFRAVPVLVLAATTAAAALVPVLRAGPPAFPLGDALMLLGLLALARFLTAVGALDAGGAFGGMGASREMMVAPLIEPVLMMVVFSSAIFAGTTELRALAAYRGAWTSWIVAWRAADFLGFAAMLVLLPAETGRIPVDNPDTHLELTMLHEGMLLEHSGPGLGCMLLASHTRQIVTLGLVSALFFPVGHTGATGGIGLLAGAGAFALEISLLALFLALVESSYAKLRLFRVPPYLGVGFACALTALALRIL
ncbi:MAG: NADH-quinone oxidoreductase subunit H [Gemmatimonadaceae bacterium]|nr:NADH-quinone oxidoreductase subunit H [Gemmatimonadaceae bacterium]